jgi:hypothetical protein
MATVKEWKRYFAIASDQGEAYALKFADSCVRFRKHTQKLEKKKHSIIFLDKAPTQETKKCGARLINGGKCTFKATCGEYCRKHALKT